MKKILKKLDDLHPVLKGFLFGAIPAAIGLGLVVLFSKIDTEPDFNEGFLRISASFAQVFAQEFKLGLALVGVLVAGLVPAGYNWKYKGLSAGTGEYSGGHAYAIGWVLFLILAVASFNFNYNSAEYQVLVSEAEFYFLRSHPEEVWKLFVK